MDIGRRAIRRKIGRFCNIGEAFMRGKFGFDDFHEAYTRDGRQIAGSVLRLIRERSVTRKCSKRCRNASVAVKCLRNT